MPRPIRLLMAACAATLPLLALADEAQDRALLDAARAQRSEQALAALAAGASVTAKEGDGTTALHYAAHFGDAKRHRRAAEGQGRSERAQRIRLHAARRSGRDRLDASPSSCC